MLTAAKSAGWNTEDPLTSDEMNHLQAELLKAIDGVNGGEYELLAELVLSGAAVIFASAVTLGGPVTITSGLSFAPGSVTHFEGESSPFADDGAWLVFGATAKLILQARAELRVEGSAMAVFDATSLCLFDGGTLEVRTSSLDVTDGGSLTIDADSFLELDGACTVSGPSGVDLAVLTIGTNGVLSSLAGADFEVRGPLDLIGASARINVGASAKIVGGANAQIEVFDAEDLVINNSTGYFRITLVPLFIREQSPGSPAWKFGSECAWLCSDARGGEIVFPFALRPGDVVTTLRVTLDGGTADPGGLPHGGSSPAVMPTLQLVKVSANGVRSTIATANDPVTSAAYDDPHQIVLSDATAPAIFPYTMTADVHYVRVFAEGSIGAPGVNDTTRLCSIDGTLQAKKFRPTDEVYT